MVVANARGYIAPRAEWSFPQVAPRHYGHGHAHGHRHQQRKTDDMGMRLGVNTRGLTRTWTRQMDVDMSMRVGID